MTGTQAYVQGDSLGKIFLGEEKASCYASTPSRESKQKKVKASMGISHNYFLVVGVGVLMKGQEKC